jgi:DtxR family transcriptional regulator, iron-dependent repressor
LHLRSSLHFGIEAYFFESRHHARAVEDPLIPNDLSFGKSKKEGESIINRAACGRQSEPTDPIRSGCLPEDYSSVAVHQNVGNLKCKIAKGREQCLPRSSDSLFAVDFTEYGADRDCIIRIEVHQSRHVALTCRLSDLSHELLHFFAKRQSNCGRAPTSVRLPRKLQFGLALKITISKENYLKTIAEAESEGEPVIAATLARWLNVSAPAVTMAIKRLKRDGLIRVSREGQLSLAPAGRDIANRLLNRHHLIERMLTEIFGMEWYKVHDEAEQLEHAVSADFERCLAERLGTGEACPHGNRVERDTPQDRRDRGLQPLDEISPQSEATVISVFERDRRLLEYLNGLGIYPGATVRMQASNYDDTLTLRIEGKPVQLGRGAASKVWVAVRATPSLAAS